VSQDLKKEKWCVIREYGWDLGPNITMAFMALGGLQRAPQCFLESLLRGTGLENSAANHVSPCAALMSGTLFEMRKACFVDPVPPNHIIQIGSSEHLHPTMLLSIMGFLLVHCASNIWVRSNPRPLHSYLAKFPVTRIGKQVFDSRCAELSAPGWDNTLFWERTADLVTWVGWDS